MRIAVMGAGSVGGYLGGMLARGGHDVSLIARGAHLAAIRERGLHVLRDSEEFTVCCAATDNPGDVGQVDLALLTVKTYQNEAAVPAMVPMVGPDTTILCLQNGVDSYLRLQPLPSALSAFCPVQCTSRQVRRALAWCGRPATWCAWCSASRTGRSRSAAMR